MLIFVKIKFLGEVLTMQIEKLFYYTKVVEKGSISKAAEYLHISQQALSQSMCNLEKDLGVKLFSS